MSTTDIPDFLLPYLRRHRPVFVDVSNPHGVHIDLAATTGIRQWSVELGLTAAQREVRRMNRTMVDIARECVPEGTADVIAHYARVQAELSLTRARAETYTDIGRLCARMPRLANRLRRGMLSYEHLRVFARCADGISYDDTRAAEDALIAVLTPRRDGQNVPGPRALSRKILGALEAVDAYARPVDPEEPVPSHPEDPNSGTLTRRVGVDTYDPCATVITATLPPAEAEEFLAVLDGICRSMEVSRADGLLHLARGTADVSVTLNVYREINSDLVVTDGGHWLDAVATERFMERVTHLRIPGHDITDSYTPTEQIRSFVTAMYGTCTYPGCDVPAVTCDLDHVHRYNHDDPAAGGPTSTRNLHPVCRTHHRMKTVGLADVTRAPDGAVMWSSIDDGHTGVTEPAGPLAEYARTSVAEDASRRYTTVREHNARRLAANAERDAVLSEVRAAVKVADREEVPF